MNKKKQKGKGGPVPFPSVEEQFRKNYVFMYNVNILAINCPSFFL